MGITAIQAPAINGTASGYRLLPAWQKLSAFLKKHCLDQKGLSAFLRLPHAGTSKENKQISLQGKRFQLIFLIHL